MNNVNKYIAIIGRVIEFIQETRESNGPIGPGLDQLDLLGTLQSSSLRVRIKESRLY